MDTVIAKIEHALDIQTQTTKPKECTVNPNKGIILPISVCNVTVKIEKQNKAPPSMECKYKFRVHALVAPNGITENNITTRMFDKEENKVLDEFTLRAVYIPVLEDS
ncbi:hypothetical protein L2E82_29536 [Cichorium intybus]|uniref:Uncharacterized protein n=1 Tax=Cichorium intybus TaxID=13427 RepID=A0ACB9CY22_CICIN|nr:hypothetical protein L2E82_29536 [Cichorium intybus]